MRETVPLTVKSVTSLVLSRLSSSAALATLMTLSPITRLIAFATSPQTCQHPSKLPFYETTTYRMLVQFSEPRHGINYLYATIRHEEGPFVSSNLNKQPRVARSLLFPLQPN